MLLSTSCLKPTKSNVNKATSELPKHMFQSKNTKWSVLMDWLLYTFLNQLRVWQSGSCVKKYINRGRIILTHCLSFRTYRIAPYLRTSLDYILFYALASQNKHIVSINKYNCCNLGQDWNVYLFCYKWAASCNVCHYFYYWTNFLKNNLPR